MATGRCLARSPDGQQIYSGPCQFDSDDKGITVSPEADAPLRIPYEEVVGLEARDYRLSLRLDDGTSLELSLLGSMFGDLLGRMRVARNEVWERGLLLHGVRRIDAFSCELSLPQGPESGEIRLYEDRLSVLPERCDPFGYPYALLQSVTLDEATYQVSLGLDGGDSLIVGKLRQRTKEFAGLLSQLLTACRKRTAEALAEYLPELSSLKLQALARLLPDGLAARREDIEAIDPEVWDRLEKVVVGAPKLAETYAHLKAMASPGDVAIGIKRRRPAEDGSGHVEREEDQPPEEGKKMEIAEGSAPRRWRALARRALSSPGFCAISPGGLTRQAISLPRR